MGKSTVLCALLGYLRGRHRRKHMKPPARHAGCLQASTFTAACVAQHSMWWCRRSVGRRSLGNNAPFSIDSSCRTLDDSHPDLVGPPGTNVALVVDRTAVTRATLVRVVIAAAHETSADGALSPVAWARVVSHYN